jgi:hypothetical protein
MSSHPHSSAGSRDTGETAHAVQKASLISVLLTPPEAARLPHTNAGVLAVWRNKGKLPLSFVRVERRIFYKARGYSKIHRVAHCEQHFGTDAHCEHCGTGD